MNRNRQIRLTEQELHFIVENAVKNVLMENREDELFSGLRAVGGAFGDRMGNMGRNMMNTYRAGNQNAKVQKASQNAIKALNDLQQIALQLNPGLANTARTCISSINKVMNASQNNLQQAQQNTFSTQPQG